MRCKGERNEDGGRWKMWMRRQDGGGEDGRTINRNSLKARPNSLRDLLRVKLLQICDVGELPEVGCYAYLIPVAGIRRIGRGVG